MGGGGEGLTICNAYRSDITKITGNLIENSVLEYQTIGFAKWLAVSAAMLLRCKVNKFFFSKQPQTTKSLDSYNFMVRFPLVTCATIVKPTLFLYIKHPIAMKGRNLAFTSALVLAVGIVLILTRYTVKSDGIVLFGGSLFILAAFLNVIVMDGAKTRSEGKRESARGMMSNTFTWISSAAAMILGICMLVFKETFIALVPVIFGILVAFTAFYQLYVLAIGIRPYVLPALLYLVPVALAGAAVYMFTLTPVESDHIIMLTTGIALAVFGAAGVTEGVWVGILRKRADKAASMTSRSESAETAAAEPETATADQQKTDSEPEHKPEDMAN